jgi:hypothetical protein
LPRWWHVRSHDSGGGARRPDQRDLLAICSDNLRENAAGFFPARSASIQSNRPVAQSSTARSYAFLAGVHPTDIVAVFK